MSDVSDPAHIPNPPGSIDLSDLVLNLGKRASASAALVSGAIVEEWLQKILLLRMRPVSNRLAKRIFDRYGPLSTFAAKIDIAYAFGLLDETTFNDLRVIKEIRNKFAHSIEVTHFRSDEIDKLLRKLSNWEEPRDAQIVFVDAIEACVKHIEGQYERLMFAQALQPPGGPA